jgi:zearalenone synthase, nonreducing iterative type I polyketide synthase
MLQFLNENRSISLANLAYTTTARRNHHSFRAAYCGSSTEDITETLTNDLNGVGQQLSKLDKKAPVVFVFSGQGGSYSGMGEDLFRTSRQFRVIVTELEQTCLSLGFPPFTSLIADQDTPIETASIVQHHLSLVALQIALTKYWEFCGIKPDIVVGHSIGEYAAFCAAGVLSIFDTLYLVGKRAQLLHSMCVAGTHAMLSIAGTAKEISSFLSGEDHEGCEVSCFNSPGMIVLSGERASLLILEIALKERGLKCKLLEIPYGMHSCQMDAILPEFNHILSGVQFSKPNIKIISTLLGHPPMGTPFLEKDYLVRQTREPVKFQQAISSCLSEGFADASSHWLEIGPNSTCLGLVRANINAPSSHLLTSLKRGENNWKSVSTSLSALYMAKQSINWRAFHEDFVDSLSLVDLPKYAFDTRDFWLTYKNNDHRLQSDELAVNKSQASEPISTCLHQLVKKVDGDDKQSASFTSTLSHSSLTEILEGHRLSGISVCSAGVYLDIALTAARYLLTGGDRTVSPPALVVSDMKLERILVPTSGGSSKVLYTEITRQKHQWAEFSVAISDGPESSSSTAASCRVCLQDRPNFDIETPKLYSSLKPKISNLMAASEAGLADRIRGKVFYKLFSNLMEYSDLYKGVESAIVSDDFRELFANVHLPAQDEKRADQRFTFSPCWSDILGQTLGFLLNGNPNQAGDFVHIGGHVERFEVQARDITQDDRYQVYAYIYNSEGLEHRGNAYISHEGVVVGVLEGMWFHKMPRKTLHHLLGKTDAPEIRNGSQNKKSETVVNGSARPVDLQNGRDPNEHAVSLATAFLKILLDETGLLESEIAPSSYFSEIGVDSIFGISILAALKAETGVELGASFLSENPTLEDAQRALRIMENQKAPPPTSSTLSNGHTNGHSIEEEPPISSRESNVVLIQSTQTPSQTSLFLIADGAGSAAAYVHLPQLAPNLQVFALESPWVKDPRNFTSSFSEAAAIYLKAIRAKQPRGPYLLGGWSAGGVFAYEVSRLLLEAGEKVIGLIIIDIPAPRHVDRSKVTMPTFELVENMGLLVGIDRATANDSPNSLQLKEHMLGTVRCFSQLDPTPMEPGYRPDATFVIWATELIGPGTSNEGSAELTGPNLDAWFYPMQHDFGPNGWNLLVGDKLDCFQIPGDHFSIMNIPHVSSFHSRHPRSFRN